MSDFEVIAGLLDDLYTKADAQGYSQEEQDKLLAQYLARISPRVLANIKVTGLVIPKTALVRNNWRFLTEQEWTKHIPKFKILDFEKVIEAAFRAGNGELVLFLMNNNPRVSNFLLSNATQYHMITIDIDELYNVYRDHEEVADSIAQQLQRENIQTGFILKSKFHTPELIHGLLKRRIIPHPSQLTTRIHMELTLLHEGGDYEDAKSWGEISTESISTYNCMLWCFLPKKAVSKYMKQGSNPLFFFAAPGMVTKEENFIPPYIALDLVLEDNNRYQDEKEVPSPFIPVVRSNYNFGVGFSETSHYVQDEESPLFLHYKKSITYRTLIEALQDLLVKAEFQRTQESLEIALDILTKEHRYLVRQTLGKYKKDLKYNIKEAYFRFNTDFNPESDYFETSTREVYCGKILSDFDHIDEVPELLEALRYAATDLEFDILIITEFAGEFGLCTAIFDARPDHLQYLYYMGEPF